METEELSHANASKKWNVISRAIPELSDIRWRYHELKRAQPRKAPEIEARGLEEALAVLERIQAELNELS